MKSKCVSNILAPQLLNYKMCVPNALFEQFVKQYNYAGSYAIQGHLFKNSFFVEGTAMTLNDALGKFQNGLKSP